MSGCKFYHASDNTDSFGLAMAGSGAPLEVTQDGINFELLANSDYPNPDVDNGESGCLVILDDKNLFLAGGGNPESPRAYIYNKDANAWREVSSMTEPRYEHSCGLVRGNSGNEVVVVGGYPTYSSIEIFSIDTETWRSGKHSNILRNYESSFQPSGTFLGNDMSFGIYSAYDIRVDDTFVMVGGVDLDTDDPFGSGYSDKLIKYLTDSGTFMELPGKMKLPRDDHVAVLVDRSIFPACA